MKSILYVIPCGLINKDSASSFSKEYLEIIYGLRHFIVENVRTTRRFLRRLNHPEPIPNLVFHELNRHTTPEDWSEIEDFIKEDHHTGLLSESGCPGIADPGADLVAMAHRLKIPVTPLIGPSSVVMSLMASGLNGQNFCFNGYLDRDNAQRRKQIKSFENESFKANRTQIFIETPYRNEVLFTAMIRTLKPETMLTLACELTDPTGWVQTMSIAEWSQKKPKLNKKNTVFLFLAKAP